MGIRIFLKTLFLASLGYFLIFHFIINRTNLEENYSEKNLKILVFSPREFETIESPYRVMGMAKGMWFFEASFPIKLFDEKDNLLSVSLATALSDWMTEDFVPFVSEINFESPETESGYLLFQKDNPTGLPEFDDEYRLPIKFFKKPFPKRTVSLFYYNQPKDEEISGGNISCSLNALLPLQREIKITKTPIKDTLNLLLLSELTKEEKELGFATEFPNKDFKIIGVNLKNGILQLEFNEVPGFTTGGSCRVGILSEQIRKTALQFSEVKEVIFMPESIFQP